MGMTELLMFYKWYCFVSAVSTRLIAVDIRPSLLEFYWNFKKLLIKMTYFKIYFY